MKEKTNCQNLEPRITTRPSCIMSFEHFASTKLKLLEDDTSFFFFTIPTILIAYLLLLCTCVEGLRTNDSGRMERLLMWQYYYQAAAPETKVHDNTCALVPRYVPEYDIQKDLFVFLGRQTRILSCGYFFKLLYPIRFRTSQILQAFRYERIFQFMFGGHNAVWWCTLNILYYRSFDYQMS